MKKVRYVGWRQDLQGRTALADPLPRFSCKAGSEGQRRVLIQLDDLGECDELGTPLDPNPLCFGWHDFAADQWEEIEEGE